MLREEGGASLPGEGGSEASHWGLGAWLILSGPPSEGDLVTCEKVQVKSGHRGGERTCPSCPSRAVVQGCHQPSQ